MDRHDRTGGGFSRPPPTSPRGHPKKRPRWEGPPRPSRDEAEWSRPPPSMSPPAPGARFGDDDDPRESKPHHLGGYLIQPEFKIRGKSHAPPSKSGASEKHAKSEAGYDSDPDPAPLGIVGNLDRAFSSAAQSILAHAQNIEADAANSGHPPAHPIRRAAERIKAQLDRLDDVYCAIGREVDGMASELDRFAAREDGLRRDLDECKTANFKLGCGKKDLADQIRDLKCAAAEAEVEVRRLKRAAEDREGEHGRLEGSLCELQEERRKTAAEKLWLEQTVRKHEADVEKAAAESRRLQTLVQERDAEVEGLKSNNLGLQSLVQQRQAEVKATRADNARLQGLLREKEAMISSLSALPITPLSPMGPPGPFPLPAAPRIQTSQQAQTLTSRPSSPLPYIKQEPSDITPLAVVLPQQLAPAEQPQDPTQQLHQLGAGAADVLSKLFDISHPTPHNAVLSSFLTNLGAAPEASSIAVTPATVTSFWTLADPWTPNTTTTPPVLRPTLEEQFAHLCLLFPFPGTHQAPDHDSSSPGTFRLLASLLTNLIRADYTTSPRAGWAFLQSMSAPGRTNMNLLPPHGPFMSGSGPGYAAHTAAAAALLGTMLCELCRVLAHTFPGGGHGSGWDLATVLGPGVYDAIGGVEQPLARLAALLRDVDRSVAAVDDGGDGGDSSDGGGRVLKEGLKGCGDRFCVFRHTLSPSPSPGSEAEEKDIGLLHCGGESSSFFLMVDFRERSLRTVDCRLAAMRPNLAEPRKLDLIVARTTHAGQGREEEGEGELFRVAAAPRDAAAFWVKYAMGDV